MDRSNALEVKIIFLTSTFFIPNPAKQTREGDYDE